MRMLVFGDSIAQGYWDAEGGWVDRLRKYYDALQLEDFDRNDVPRIINLGIAGNTTRDILARIGAETAVRATDDELPVVVVQIGMNDSSLDHGKISIDQTEYEQNLVDIIEKVRPISSKLIFVGLPCADEPRTLPVAWGDYRHANSNIKAYEDATATVTKDHDIAFIPVFDAFMAAFKSDPSLLFDGLHPNDKGHEQLLQIIQPKLSPLLSEVIS